MRTKALLLLLCSLAYSGCAGHESLPGGAGSTDATYRSVVAGVSQPVYSPNRLTAFNGLLYGTASFGGAHGGGEVFSVTPNGLLNPVYVFSAAASSVGALDIVGSDLYGANYTAGHSRVGRIFDVTLSGKLVREYSFAGVPDGSHPGAGLIDDGHGTLYGTTVNGGTYNHGSIYKIDAATLNETVLYSFQYNQNDGGLPSDRLTLVNGTLYGTTAWGGGAGYGNGTVFAYDLSAGRERVLYKFKGGNDGSAPVGGVTYVGGKLYGATAQGGNANGCINKGCGVVYSIDSTSGKETVLYTFVPLTGDLADTDLTLFNGKLYGTTAAGGNIKNNLNGTIFSLDPSTGKVSILYTLQSTDGMGPQDLTPLGGHLYGNAPQGGANGRGTIFRFDPPSTFKVIYNF